MGCQSSRRHCCSNQRNTRGRKETWYAKTIYFLGAAEETEMQNLILLLAIGMSKQALFYSAYTRGGQGTCLLRQLVSMIVHQKSGGFSIGEYDVMLRKHDCTSRDLQMIASGLSYGIPREWGICLQR